MKKMLLIALLGSSSFLFAQTVCTGTIQQCMEAQQKLCASEPAPANLKLLKDRMVTGVVTDQTGARFQGGIEIQLRVPEKGAVLRSAIAWKGNFSLGRVRAGSYRLIIVKTGKKGVERLRGFDQPKSLACADGTGVCQLSVVPKVHGTDNTIDFCPPN